MSTPFRRYGLVVAMSAMLVAGCGTAADEAQPSATAATGAAPRVGAPRVSTTPVTPSLTMAEQESRDLGPVPKSQKITVTLTLRGRAAGQLNSLLAKGGRLTPAQWAAHYGPAPSAVAATRLVLARAGIPSTWQRGNVSLAVTAPAAALERFFHQSIDRFVMPNGVRFYAPRGVPSAPRSIAKEVVAVTGMNDYRDVITEAIGAKGGTVGVTPAEMTEFYDLTPLRSAGLDGSGMTVMFPEWAAPSSDVLDAFASKFNLPPFNVSVVTNAAKWGAPVPTTNSVYDTLAGETSLDLEVVHGLAPAAKEIVYAAGNASELNAMLQAMITAHPGAILSSSISSPACEQDQGAKQIATGADAVFAQAASEGTSIYWAAGDRGAYGCLPDGDKSTASDISVMPQGSTPHETVVGGTTVFLASNGGYYKETAWGDPLEQWGGGGGYSTFFGRPSWQTGPGVGSSSARGVPDVSANAATDSPWDIFVPTSSGAQEDSVSGTSAATPFWAAITALMDQFLLQQHLKTVGFANPALYYFAQNPSGMPAVPFHQVTEGNNLHYQAASGWNPATGLGSPDVAHLADDFEWYDKAHGGSS